MDEHAIALAAEVAELRADMKAILEWIAVYYDIERCGCSDLCGRSICDQVGCISLKLHSIRERASVT